MSALSAGAPPAREHPLLLGKHPGPVTHLTPQSLGNVLRGEHSCQILLVMPEA